METQERARECRNEMARGEQVGTKVNGEGFQTYPWHVQTAGVKSLCHVHIAPRSRWREDPRFVDELGRPARRRDVLPPWTCCPAARRQETRADPATSGGGRVDFPSLFSETYRQTFPQTRKTIAESKW